MNDAIEITVPRPYLEHGFWWWYDPERKDWFVGPSPSIGFPKFWKPNYKLLKPSQQVR